MCMSSLQFYLLRAELCAACSLESASWELPISSPNVIVCIVQKRESSLSALWCLCQVNSAVITSTYQKPLHAVCQWRQNDFCPFTCFYHAVEDSFKSDVCQMEKIILSCALLNYRFLRLHKVYILIFHFRTQCLKTHKVNIRASIAFLCFVFYFGSYLIKCLYLGVIGYSKSFQKQRFGQVDIYWILKCS